MPNNKANCKAMHIIARNPLDEYFLLAYTLERSGSEKDLAVVITSNLKFVKQPIAAKKHVLIFPGFIERKNSYHNK